MRIVVSGIGLVTPLAASRETTWARLLAGDSAIRFEPYGLEASLKNFSMNGTRSRMGDFAVAATKEALAHAEIDETFIAGNRMGCAISQSKPILPGHIVRHSEVAEATEESQLLLGRDLSGIRLQDDILDPALLMSSFFGFSSESCVIRDFKLTGPAANISAACATGIASIETGLHWIRAGQCDVALVGASESSLNRFFRSGFERLGVLAQGTAPSSACPFDKNRSGFVMGEGAAVLVLESEASAKKRNHRPLACVLSVRMRHSSCDILRFDPDGSAISQLISSVTNQVRPDYINAHGTGTVFNDVVESKGIRLAFGNRADSISISSTKAATGHLLGAAGAVEAAVAVLSIRDQMVPPTLHLNEPDPECNLDFIPHRSRKQKVNTSMSLSYGFGGQMGAVLFGAC